MELKMAIVAKSIMDARRAAAAAAAAADNTRSKRANAKPASDDISVADGGERVATQHSPSRLRKRGHAVKSENGKYEPTADYEVGFARPPEHSRFKRGGKPGPGRPKGSTTHDAMLKKQLSQKREVSIGGRRQSIAASELVLISTMKAALEGKDKQARAYILAQSERLYPSSDASESRTTPVALSESDELTIEEFKAELRQQLLEELRAERGFDAGEAR